MTWSRGWCHSPRRVFDPIPPGINGGAPTGQTQTTDSTCIHLHNGQNHIHDQEQAQAQPEDSESRHYLAHTARYEHDLLLSR